MIRGDEVPELLEEVAVKVLEKCPVGPGFNEALRESSEIVANVDKGFQHYVKYFRNELPVTAAVRVEKGHHGEYGWGVYFEQGRHRCILAGTVAEHPEEEAWEDAMWTACAEWASFEPVLGRPKIHKETLLAPDEFGHIFAGNTFEAKYSQASGCYGQIRARDSEVCTGVRVSIGVKRGSLEAGRRLCVLCGRFTEDPDLGWTFALGGRSGGFRSLVISIGGGDVPRVRLQFARRGTSPGMARRGRNRIKRFRAGLGPGQCSHLFWRILAETFTTRRLTQPMVGAGT
jgi:hypothetical protein